MRNTPIHVKTGVKERVGFPDDRASRWSEATFSADGRRMTVNASSSSDGARVVVWDRDARKLRLDSTPVHRGAVVVGLSADGKTAASAASPARPVPADNVIQVWDVDAGTERVRVRADHRIGSVGVSPDGTRLAAANHQRPGMALYDATRGAIMHQLDAHVSAGGRPVFSTDGRRLAAPMRNGEVRVWDVATGKRLSATPGPTEACAGVAFAGPDRGVAWGIRGREALAWEFPSGKLLTPRGPHGHVVTAVAFSADGRTAFSGDAGGVLAEWPPAKPAGAKLTPFRLPDPPPEFSNVPSTGPLSIAPGGKHVAMFVESRPETDHVYDRASGRRMFSFSRERHFVGVPATFSPAGDRLFLPRGRNDDGGPPEPAGVYDVATGKRLTPLGIATFTHAATFSPDGSRLVTVGQGFGVPERNLTVTGWDARSGQKRGEIVFDTGHTHPFLAVTNTGSAAAAEADGLIGLDVTGSRVGEVFDRFEAERRGETGALVFSPDSKLLAAGVPTDSPGVYGVRVYEWPSGRRLHEFTGHTGRVTALAFSADGKLLASGSEDTSVVVWDMSVVGKR